MKYETKGVIVLDNDRLIADGYHLDEVYNYIRSLYKGEKSIKDISQNEQEIVIIDNNGDPSAWGLIGLTLKNVYDSELRSYIKVLNWHEVDEDGIENIQDAIEGYKQAESKYQQKMEAKGLEPLTSR